MDPQLKKDVLPDSLNMPGSPDIFRALGVSSIAGVARTLIRQPVSSIMLSRDEISIVPPEMALKDVLHHMNGMNRGYTFVERDRVAGTPSLQSPESKRELCGIFTERNLLFNVDRLIEARMESDPESIQSVFTDQIWKYMTSDVSYVEPQWRVLYALREMNHGHFRRLAVGDGKELVGAVSERTIVNYVLSIYRNFVGANFDQLKEASEREEQTIEDKHDADLGTSEQCFGEENVALEIDPKDAFRMSQAVLFRPIDSIMRRPKDKYSRSNELVVPHFPAHTPLKEVILQMRNLRFGYCMITEETSLGLIAKGIFTERDYQRDVLPKVETFSRFSPQSIPELYKAPIGDYMTAGVLSVGPEDTILTALELMNRHYFRRVAVVDHLHRLLGVVSERTIVNAINDIFQGAILCGPPVPQNYGWTTR